MSSSQKNSPKESKVPFLPASDSGDDKKLSIPRASMALMNSVVGGGIVSLPFSMAQIGVVNAVLLHMLVLFMVNITLYIFLRLRTMYKSDSYTDLSYICFGNSSVYMLNTLIFVCICGILAMFFILMSDIVQSLMTPEMLASPIFDFIALKTIVVLIVNILLMPFFLKKHLADLKMTSYL